MTSGVEAAKRPEKTSFSVTCSLLSQYIKEKGSLADLGFGKVEINRLPTTMNLISGVDAKDETRSAEVFPQITGFGPTKAEAKPPENSQLTIFYGGKVLVFDNFPSEKAEDLMQIASKGQILISGTTSAVSGVPVADTQTSPATTKTPASFPARSQPNFSELPIARKASLHRFLEKRKDRISAKSPYQQSSTNGFKETAAVNEEEISQPWLGLGQHISKPGFNSNFPR